MIVTFRRLLYLFHDNERWGGRVEIIRAGGMAESWWAASLSYAKITLLFGFTFVLDCTRKKPKRAAFITPTA